MGKVGYPWESTRDIYQHISPIYVFSLWYFPFAARFWLGTFAPERRRFQTWAASSGTMKAWAFPWGFTKAPKGIRKRSGRCINLSSLVLFHGVASFALFFFFASFNEETGGTVWKWPYSSSAKNCRVATATFKPSAAGLAHNLWADKAKPVGTTATSKHFAKEGMIYGGPGYIKHVFQN